MKVKELRRVLMSRMAVSISMSILCLTRPLFGREVRRTLALAPPRGHRKHLADRPGYKTTGSQLTGTLLVDWGNLTVGDGRVQDHHISVTVNIAPTHARKRLPQRGFVQVGYEEICPRLPLR
jgi:hypothetical protein